MNLDNKVNFRSFFLTRSSPKLQGQGSGVFTRECEMPRIYYNTPTI